MKLISEQLEEDKGIPLPFLQDLSQQAIFSSSPSAPGQPLPAHSHFKRAVPGCREGNGTPLQYSCLETPMDGGAWWATVHGVAMSRTRLSDLTFTFHFHALEKEMATHSSVLA